MVDGDGLRFPISTGVFGSRTACSPVERNGCTLGCDAAPVLARCEAELLELWLLVALEPPADPWLLAELELPELWLPEELPDELDPPE